MPNVFDELDEAAAPVEQPTPESAESSPNLFDQVDEEGAADRERLNAVIGAAGQVAPERQADVVRLSERTGLAPRVVSDAYESLKPLAAQEGVDPEQWRARHPHLAKLLLERPELAPVAVGDGPAEGLPDALAKPKVMRPEEKGLASQVVTAIGDWALEHPRAAALASPGLSLGFMAGPVPAAIAGTYELATSDKPLPQLRPLKLAEMQESETAGKTGLLNTTKMALEEYRYTRDNLEMSRLGTRLMLAIGRGDAEGAAEIEQQIADAKAALGPQRYYGASFGEKLALDAVQGIASSLPGTLKQAGAGAVGLGIGALTKNPAAGATAAKWLSRLVGFADSMDLEAGGDFLQFRDIKGPDGAQVPASVAAGAALVSGAIKAAIEVGANEKILSAFGPVGKLMRGMEKGEIVRSLMHDGSFRAMLKTAGDEWLGAAKGEATEEMSQQAVEKAVGYLVDRYAGNNPEIDPAAILGDITEAGVKGAVGSLGMGAFSVPMNIAQQAYGRSRLLSADAQVQAIAEGARTSRLAAASPESYARAVELATTEQGRPVTHLYIDPKAVVQLFQDSGEDLDHALAELMGESGPGRFRAAVEGERLLEVPVAEYTERWAQRPISEHLAGNGHITTRSYLMTRAQMAEDQKAIDAEADALVEAYRQENLPEPQSEPERQFRDALAAQIRLARSKTTKDQAELQAKILAAGPAIPMKRYGFSAEKAFAAFNVVVRSPSEMDLAGEATVTEMSKASEDARRASRAIAPEYQRMAAQAQTLEYYQDPITGTYNVAGAERLLRVKDAAPVIWRIRGESFKPTNDIAGHEMGNQRLRHLVTTAESVPGAALWTAKVGNDIVGGAATAEQARAIFDAIRKDTPEAIKLVLETGENKGDLHETIAGLSDEVKPLRAAKTYAHRKGIPVALLDKDEQGQPIFREVMNETTGEMEPEAPSETEIARFKEALKHYENVKGKTAFDVHPELVAYERGLSERKRAEDIYLDRANPLLLNARGWAAIRKHERDYVMSLDFADIKAMDHVFGHGATDNLIIAVGHVFAKIFAPQDAARLSGDEHAAQGDDLDVLENKRGALREELADRRFFARLTDEQGKPYIVVQEGVYFGAGIAKKWADADGKNLEDDKAEAKKSAKLPRRLSDEEARALGFADDRAPEGWTDVGSEQPRPPPGVRGQSFEGLLSADDGQGVRVSERGLGAGTAEAGSAASPVARPAARGQVVTPQGFFQPDLAQPPAPVPRWFSQAARAASEAKQQKGTPSSWLAVISKAPGVKAEEIEFLGLKDWLDKQKGTITKEQVVAFIDANKLEVEERELGPRGESADGVDDLGLEWGNFPDASGTTAAELAKLFGNDGDTYKRDAPAEEMLSGQAERVETDRNGHKHFLFKDGSQIALEGESVYALDGHSLEPVPEEYEGAKDDSTATRLDLAIYSGDTEERIEDAAERLGGERVSSDHYRRAYRFDDGSIWADTGTGWDVAGPLHEAKHEQHTLGGHKEGSYRELVFYAPGTPADDYQAPEVHFDKAVGKGALAHARISEHTVGGKQALMVEEVQSDLHQAGRDKGYRDDEAFEGVPDAPLKTTWDEFVVKRLIRYAAEHGFERIAWTTGDQQAERYDLSKQVDELILEQSKNGGGHLIGMKDGDVIVEKHVESDDALASEIGKEAAKKLLAAGPDLDRIDPIASYTTEAEAKAEAAASSSPVVVLQPAKALAGESVPRWNVYDKQEIDAASVKSISGNDLKVGGEGMRFAYDKRLPSVVSKLLKKFGGKVEKATLGSGERRAQDAESEARPPPEVWSADLPQALRETALREGFALFQPAFHGTPHRGIEKTGFSLQKIGTGEGAQVYEAARDQTQRGPRGWVQFATEGGRRLYNVFLNRHADLSTFLHESGHVYLDVLGQLAQEADAPESLRRDYQTALEWLGVASHEEMLARADDAAAILATAKAAGREMTEREKARYAELVAPMEKWARGFEAYLMEGKAPSISLRRAFASFARWLKGIYKSVTSLNVELNDEVRAVFDRLLATDEEIDAARQRLGLNPMFRSPEEAGMQPGEWAKYLEDQEKATSRAAKASRLADLREQLRAVKAGLRDGEKALRRTLEREYAALPEVRGQALLRSGVLLDESGTRTIAQGFDPESLHQAAQLLGFGSEDELERAVREMPDKSVWIADRMKERAQHEFESLTAERDRLAAAVAKGLHGDESASWLYAEFAALRAKAGPGQKAPRLEAIRLAAEKLVRDEPIGRLPVARVQHAERSAAEKAAKAAGQGDFAQAYVQKHRQLLNHFMWRELDAARDNRARLEKLASGLAKETSRARLGRASPALRDAVDTILEGLGFSEPRPQDPAAPRLGFLDALRQMEENGTSINFDPDRILGTVQAKTPWKELSIADAENLLAALKQFRHAGAEWNQVILDEEKAEKTHVVEQLVAEARANLPERPPPPSSVAASGVLDSAVSLAHKLDGDLLRPATILDMLGGKNRDSMWNRAIGLVLQRAKQREYDILKTAIKPVYEAMRKMPESVAKSLTDDIDGAALFPGHRRDLQAPSKRFELLAMALNMGNASNKKRLLEGRGITEEQVMAALNGTEYEDPRTRKRVQHKGLTAAEWDWVETVWDSAESLWPASRDLEERTTGVAPPKIPAVPFTVTVDGKQRTIKGGYFPAVYDRRANTEVGERQAMETIASMQPQGYVRPGTPHNHLKKRAQKFADVIALDLTSAGAHLSQVAHDLAFREALRSVGSLVLDHQIQGVLKERLGPEWSGIFLRWLQDVGQARGSEVATYGTAQGFGRIFRKMRSNMAIATLGYAADIAMGDISNLVFAKVGTDLRTGHWAAGLAEFARNPLKSRAWALEKSGELRFRQEGVDREFRQALDRMTAANPLRKGALAWLKDHAFTFMEWTDAATATPIWIGRYRQGLAEGLSEQKAVEAADSLIRSRFPSHSAVDQAALLRDKGAAGSLLLFAGFFNVVHNAYREAIHPVYLAVHQEEGRAGAVAKASAKAAMQMLTISAAVSVMGDFLTGRGPSPDDGDDEVERWARWFTRTLLLGPLQAMPFAGPAMDILSGRKPSARAAPAVAVLDSMGNAVWQAWREGGDPTKAAEAATKAAAMLLGMPGVRPARAGGYIARHELGYGDREDLVLRYVSGVVYGDRGEHQSETPLTVLSGRRAAQ